MTWLITLWMKTVDAMLDQFSLGVSSMLMTLFCCHIYWLVCKQCLIFVRVMVTTAFAVERRHVWADVVCISVYAWEALSRGHHCESRFDYHQACRKRQKSRCHFRQSTQNAGPHQQGCFILLLPSTSTIRQLRRVVAQDVRQRLVSALIFSRVDYCNSSLAGLPAGAFAPLQRVLNAATRFVADLRPRDHVTSVQRSLHWLPIHQRIQYKLCVLMYGAAHGHAPDYISNLATLTSATSGRSHLRSADSLTFNIPRTRTRMGDRVLSVAGSRAWNALPADIRCAPVDTFVFCCLRYITIVLLSFIRYFIHPVLIF